MRLVLFGLSAQLLTMVKLQRYITHALRSELESIIRSLSGRLFSARLPVASSMVCFLIREDARRPARLSGDVNGG
jgi:hypothetical protein